MVVDFFEQRRAGILLHPTSLPGPYRVGILDGNAYQFVDFLAQCQFKVWQILPLCPVYNDGSPYNSTSAFAGNPDLISVKLLYADFFDKQDMSEPTDYDCKRQQLYSAYLEFQDHSQQHIQESFEAFIRDNQFWLDDFALFSTLYNTNNQVHWNQWPDEQRQKSLEACQQIKEKHKDQFQYVLFEQFVFFYQWQKLKQYTNSKNIEIIGDIPIFVSDNSADVWSFQNLFKIDQEGNPVVVAGVPPDYFSATGQRWGNPLYDWDAMENDDFSWWLERMSHALKLFDCVRIDHFRGFSACWEIPANEPTAINGQWVSTPGQKLLAKLNGQFGKLPIIAEDLGIITEDVEKLRDDFNLPGMKILQFAYDSDAHNPYLPHNHIQKCVVYTGTHDNDTSLGWFVAATPATKQRLNEYMAWPKEPMPWPLIKSALGSVAKLAVIPMQDILSLDSGCRMNTPGTTTGNWQWRFQWQQINHDLAGYLSGLNTLFLRN